MSLYTWLLAKLNLQPVKPTKPTKPTKPAPTPRLQGEALTAQKRRAGKASVKARRRAYAPNAHNHANFLKVKLRLDALRAEYNYDDMAKLLGVSKQVLGYAYKVQRLTPKMLGIIERAFMKNTGDTK